jgi:pyruvate dehydrogenase E1 component beta subunit
VLTGLVDEFGKDRIIDTPISEAGFTGLGVGAAMAGLRPIVDIMFGDFMTIIMDQLVNQAAKIHYMSGGHWKVPMVVRCTMGATRRSAAQHSQSLHAWPSHVPGLKVIVPSTPYDAKGLLLESIFDDSPVMFFEHLKLYVAKGPVPEEPYRIPLGVADVRRAGSDVTVVAIAAMVDRALQAADVLAEAGTSVEVIDPRTLAPLDLEAIVASVRRTHRLVVAHEAVLHGGFGAEIAAQVQAAAFDELDAPIERVGAPFAPVPFSPPLEDAYLPSRTHVAAAVRALLGR